MLKNLKKIVLNLKQQLFKKLFSNPNVIKLISKTSATQHSRRDKWKRNWNTEITCTSIWTTIHGIAWHDEIYPQPKTDKKSTSYCL